MTLMQLDAKRRRHRGGSALPVAVPRLPRIESGRTGRLRRLFLVAATLPALLAASAHAADQERVRWLGEMRQIAFYAPMTATGRAPLLLVLGEPGRSARYALNSWRAAAERHGFIVASVSSQNGRQWRAPQDGPGLLRAVVQKVASLRAVDKRRLYLFGSNSGSGFALAMGALQPRYFAAVAGFDGHVIAGALSGVERFERPLPVFIFHSKRYLQFDVEALERTAADLRALGAEATLEKLPVGPDFERKGAGAAGRIWGALSEHVLDEAPRYSSTQFDR